MMSKSRIDGLRSWDVVFASFNPKNDLAIAMRPRFTEMLDEIERLQIEVSNLKLEIKDLQEEVRDEQYTSKYNRVYNELD